jgi:hypothetical protein
VVLDFDGPKAEKFHEDVVKLIKKSHTVVSTEKWIAAAEELDAGKVTEKNVKKIAKKLKLDGVITGKIDKRRDEYIIKLKLRSGTSGEILGNTVQTKADGPRLDGQAQRDIKDELVAQIDELESNRSGGGSDEADEDKPKKKKGDDVVEDKPKKSGFGRKSDEDKPKKADEDKPKKSDEDKPKKKQRDDDEATALATEDEDKPKRRKKSEDDEDKPKKKKKRSASAEDGEEDSVEEEADDEPGDAALNVSPGRRAIDAVVGLSFTARNLKFTYASDLGKVPPGYRWPRSSDTTAQKKPLLVALRPGSSTGARVSSTKIRSAPRRWARMWSMTGIRWKQARPTQLPSVPRSRWSPCRSKIPAWR